MIYIYTIEKNSNDEFENIIKNYQKMIQKYNPIKAIKIFSNKIAKAQDQNTLLAKKSYTEAFSPYLKGFNIALDPAGKELDSFEFTKLFEKNTNINFFIGGAYGFEDDFLKKCNLKISLSKLTMSHKVAKVVLYEQIYRAYTILNNHPYHK